MSEPKTISEDVPKMDYLDIPKEIYDAENTIHVYAAMHGWTDWLFGNVASRNYTERLIRERKELEAAGVVCVKSMILENTRLRAATSELAKELQQSDSALKICRASHEAVVKERDAMKADNDKLRAENEALAKEIAEMKEDAEDRGMERNLQE